MIEQKSSFRVIIHKQNSAIENMSTDHALLENFEPEDKAILRLYYWNKSFTIGISQDFSSYSFCKDYNYDCAKRVTGGGVLFHGHDLSYSLVIPTKLLSSYNIKQSYEKICYFLIDFYKNLGLNTCYAKDDDSIQLSKSDFCQVGFEAYDILVNGQKIGGNAQRRTKKAIFQHGSVPLKKILNESEKDKFGISLEDLDLKLSYEQASKKLIDSFQRVFNVDIEYSDLNEDEKEVKSKLLKEKYDYSY